MSNEKTTGEKRRPSHRVSFARIRGSDENGQDVLGPARQIGAVWPRKGREGSGILRLDMTPKEMEADRGVIFIDPFKERGESANGRDEGRDTEPEIER